MEPKTSRRDFLRTGAAIAGIATAAYAGSTTPAFMAKSPETLPVNPNSQRFRPHGRFGLGGVPFGNAFVPTTETEFIGAIDAAWDEGVRYFDTSPWYGLGLSERRLGVFLQSKNREDYVISTKIGRLLKPDVSKGRWDKAIWKEAPSFDYSYDYSAKGTRQSIEDSLQRLGLAQLDMVFIHDLSPDNWDIRDNWEQHFDIARTGAMVELTRMREEGLIKAWGMGVNEIEPARRALEVADPDVILLATHYSLIKHQDALTTLFPLAQTKAASIVVGTPLLVGFLAGRQRYLWDGTIPAGALEKRARLSRIAQDHGTSLLAASLQFCNAPEVVSAVIPGARNAHQVRENAAAMRAEIPTELWQVLKREKLIADAAPIP